MKTSTLIINLILITVVGISTQSCKKGENDPFLSFRSRDGRLTRSWSLTSIDETKTTNTKNGGITITSVTTITYSDGVRKTVQDNNPSITDNFTFEITFDKRGIVTFKLAKFDDKGKSSGVYEGAGRWTWKDTDKRKSTVFLSFDEVEVDKIFGGDWDVDQLKKKELILKNSFTSKLTLGSNSSETVFLSLYTFTEI
jgi:hypothetical protein